MGRFEDLTGRQFGRLTVLKFDHISESGHAYWLCRCSCEAHNEKVVSAHSLKTGGVQSCGCMQGEHLRTHGEAGSRLYQIWSAMKARCYNPNSTSYPNYGAKGITICNEWLHDYVAFRDWALDNGYRDDLIIDRIDVNGNYCPENCRWATYKQQANNKTDNRRITYCGKTQTISGWADELGLPYQTLLGRLNSSSMSLKDAFTLPIQKFEKLLEYKGEVHTQAEWERITRLGDTLRSRLRQGWSIEQAIETPININISQAAHGSPMRYKDDFLPLKELCRKYGKVYRTVVTRMQRGMSLEEAMDTPTSDGTHDKSRKVEIAERGGLIIDRSRSRIRCSMTFKGETHTLYEWSKILGISQQTMASRLAKGWSVERILTTPTGKQGQRNANKKSPDDR